MTFQSHQTCEAIYCQSGWSRTYHRWNVSNNQYLFLVIMCFKDRFILLHIYSTSYEYFGQKCIVFVWTSRLQESNVRKLLKQRQFNIKFVRWIIHGSLKYYLRLKKFDLSLYIIVILVFITSDCLTVLTGISVTYGNTTRH